MRERAFDGPRQMLSPSLKQGETSGKKLSDEQIARDFARDIERAMEIASRSQQEMTEECGYANQGAISKLTTSREPNALARMLKVKGFKAAYILALAEDCEEIEMRTTLVAARKRA